jgi:hypothetical protein
VCAVSFPKLEGDIRSLQTLKRSKIWLLQKYKEGFLAAGGFAGGVMKWSYGMLLEKRVQVILASLVLAMGTMPIQAAETGGEAGS